MTQTVAPLLHGGVPDPLFPAVIVANGLFFLFVAGIAGSRFYGDNYYRIADHPKGHRRKDIGTYPPKALSLVWKDVRIFRRDAEQWSQLVIIGALALVYVYNFTVMPLETLSEITPLFREIMAAINVVLAGLVLTAVAARFLYVSVSLEGRSFRLVKSFPLSMGTVIRSKYLFGALPVTALIMTLVLLTNLSMGFDATLSSVVLVTAFILCLSVCALAVGLGSLRPDFEYENIASVAMGLGSVVFMFLAFILVIATVALVAGAYALYLRAASAGRALSSMEIIRIIAIAICVLVLHAAVCGYSLRSGRKALEGDLQV